MDKQERIHKKMKKREKDKKTKKIPWRAQELLDAEVILEVDFNGFPLKLLNLKNGGFKVISSFFKGRSSANERKTEKAALNQGYYLVYTLINFDDERELFLSEEGWDFINANPDLKCPHPALRNILI